MIEEGEGFVGAIRHGEGIIQKATEGINDIDWQELKARVVATIRLCLDDYVMYHVMDKEPLATV